MEELLAEMKEAIQAAIPGAEVEVSGAGGHFVIEAVSEAYDEVQATNDSLRQVRCRSLMNSGSPLSIVLYVCRRLHL